METLETIHVNKYITINIHPDYDGLNPRVDYDNFGTMVCWHSRYDLGDEQPTGSPREYQIEMANRALLQSGADAWALERKYRQPGEGWQDCMNINDWDLLERVEANPEPLERVLDDFYIMLPLYLYDHGGITMRTSAFHCAWDSGQVGFIYVSKASAIKEFGRKILTGQVKARALNCLKSEVEEYDYHLTGQVYGYTIDTDVEENVESCWGFLGDMDDCIAEAKQSAKYFVGERLEAVARNLEESRPDMYAN